MNQGEIAGLNERGFGFIKVAGRGKDLFFHATGLVDCGINDLKKGDKVTFEGVESTERGEQAYGVKLA